MQYITIENNDIPDPSSCDVTVQSLDNKAGRNKMTGYGFRYKIAEKETLNLTWGKMDKQKLERLRVSGIHKQYFYVNYISFVSGKRERKEFYIGDISYKTIHYNEADDSVWCEGVTGKLIER